MKPDLSLILNLHNETHYLARTLRSTEEAVRYAAAAGITTELVIVLDRPAAATQAWAGRYQDRCFTSIRSIVVDNGSLGPSRADGVATAEGTYITLADGDDLISFNMLTGMMDTARSAGPDTIVIPEYLLEFGERRYIVQYYGHPVVGALQTLFCHPFMSRLLMRRERFDEIAVLDIPLGTGYAFEDWHFNSEALARGMRIVTAPDTVLYYRKRRTSLSTGSKAISTGQIPPTKLAVPETFLRMLAGDYAEWMQGAAAERRAGLLEQAELRMRAFVASPLCCELTFAANQIDPAVELRRYADAPTWTNLREPVWPGLAYYRLCKIVGARRYTDVFLMSCIAHDDTATYLFNVMNGLAELYPGTTILVLTSENAAAHDWQDRLPRCATFIDLRRLSPECDEGELEVLTLKIIQATARGARIHLKHCAYVSRFWDRFGRVLSESNRGVMYRFVDSQHRLEQRLFSDGSEFNFISDHLETLHLIVADHQRVIASDHRRFDHRPERWRWLPTECHPARSVEQVQARSMGWRGRLLWAAGPEERERPHLLPLLAAALRRRGIQIDIDIHGATLPSALGPAVLPCDGLRYRGPVKAFDEFDCDAYDGFLHTAEFGGLPNVILEALGAGLPVIASEIGGIPEVVLQAQTGWLVPPCGSDAALVDGFCDAIARLYDDADRQRSMAVAAVQLIAARHGRPAFLRRLGRIFGE